MTKSTPVRVVFYVRVSRADLNADNQLVALQRMAATRGWDVVEVVSETMSGAKKRRPGLDRLLQGAHRGEFDVVAVWALDRLGRSMHGVLGTVVELDRCGVRVVSATESWLDMDGPTRPLLVAIFSWCAEQERRRIIERTHEGLARARREGKTLGRPRVSVDVDRALLLRKRGWAVREIARELGVGAGTVQRALKRTG